MKRFCAFCDQEVEPVRQGKDWTTAEPQGDFRHKKSSENGIGNCGRQFLTEAQTYTES